ncbi:MAG: PocR ligand-binding domain-containing protein [Desulfobacterales bacterium]|nr:PocR ligand-binding domain-containing protein [Desulfobacterales bacterium]
MNLTDLLPREQWAQLESELCGQTGLTVSVFNPYGIRITDFQKWTNRLCPVVKSIPRGQDFICAVAHQNVAAQAMQTRRPVLEACDAGLVKMVVPIFVKDHFLGVIGGCGALLDGEEVETFHLSRTTGLDEDEIEDLAEDIPPLLRERGESLLEAMAERIRTIVADYTGRRAAGT